MDRLYAIAHNHSSNKIIRLESAGISDTKPLRRPLNTVLESWILGWRKRPDTTGNTPRPMFYSYCRA